MGACQKNGGEGKEGGEEEEEEERAPARSAWPYLLFRDSVILAKKFEGEKKKKKKDKRRETFVEPLSWGNFTLIVAKFK